jgi:hypothetical protein
VPNGMLENWNNDILGWRMGCVIDGIISPKIYYKLHIILEKQQSIVP